MNIAHINLAKGFRGGERQTALLIKELSNVGFKQTLFIRKKNIEESLEKYIISLKISNLSIIKISKPYFLSILKFKKFDIIHAHETKANQLSFFVKKFLKIPYILTRRVQFTPSKNIFNLAIYRNAKSVAVLSTAIRDDLQKLDENMKIEIIPSAFTDFDITETVNIKHIPNNKILIGHIGAFSEEHKGQLTIIETAKLLEKERPEIHFVLIGDGKDLEYCKKEAENLKNITFLGFQNNPQKYIQNFDIFIFPSNHEGLGSTLLDVMRLKVPIIASKVGGIVDIIENNINGFLIPPKNSKKLRDKIVELISNTTLQNKFVANSFKKVNNFSPENMRKKYINLYNRG